MKGNEIRRLFLRYFEENGHTVEESSSLVPHDDPTLLFTNAGMVQFKRVFMGEEQRESKRAVTSQRCVRAGGKHNDLENVGYTARHHTFFEMLGNFSFGDYFKKDAIRFAWEFLTVKLELPKEKLWVSVFNDDDEAFELWEQVEDLPKGRIVRLGESENFWAMGDTGPCGPCSEIHIDLGPEIGCGRADCAVGCDCDRYLELWNLVFMQFNRDEDGTMTPLPKPSIDTGLGLERIAAVMQGKFNNYDSDLFTPFFDRLGKLSGKEYGADTRDTVAMRVIADHARATAFLVADGVLPSNEGRGYVLRRIMRRAIRFGRTLDLATGFFTDISLLVVEIMGDAYPHLHEARQLLDKVVSNEENRFSETLDHGLAMLEEEIIRLKEESGQETPCIDGDFIFRLYDTFGFPVDIVRDVALEKDLGFDEPGFQSAMNRQREQSKRSWKGADVEHLDNGVIELLKHGVASDFVGYDTKIVESQITALLNSRGELIDEAGKGDEVKVACEKTPFYAESGGQIGDTGTISTNDGRIVITTTHTAAEGLVLHEGVVEDGVIKKGDPVKLSISEIRRNAIAANHTATHILQAVMREVLGDHVKQAGSLVEEDRLRFDFTHFSPLTIDEITLIEKKINERIRKNFQLTTRLIDKEQAIAEGATALFGEKYGAQVRVVTIDDFSKELCGGTHVAATGEIGLFKIKSETGIASGVRRIEAETGSRALESVQILSRQAEAVCEPFSLPLDAVPEKILTLLQQHKELEKKVADLTATMAMADLDSLLAGGVEVEGLNVITTEVVLDSPKTLREIGDKVRDKLSSGVAVLGGVLNGKAALLAIVTKDITGTIKAGDLINKVAALVGGRGGGRPDMAQAGGPMADKIEQALGAVPDIVRDIVK